MSGTFAVTMGDRGRLVVPQELRERAGFVAGSPLVLVEAEGGVLLLTREQAKARVRSALAPHDLVGDLLAERRRAAVEEHRR
jgi:bifunctional DNA-binding transcriptional regulator/antitoxin component of YhaV-PrlF toxin-antitoxin module